ncbi:MAG: hypothetical protein KAR19_12675 [Bacteroidales bacterium]|nr:hypothetical protein [Bacteroidales bacterium]
MITFILKVNHKQDDKITASSSEQNVEFPIYDSITSTHNKGHMPEISLHWYHGLTFNTMKYQKYRNLLNDQLEREELVRFLRKDAIEMLVSDGDLYLKAKEYLTIREDVVKLDLKMWGMDVNRIAQIIF